jgi:hypothetical protein
MSISTAVICISPDASALSSVLTGPDDGLGKVLGEIAFVLLESVAEPRIKDISF